MRIMIVDDEPASAEYIAAVIARYANDCEVCQVAGDGEEALALLKTNNVDVVITDVAMPRMNGLKLVKTLKSEYPSIATIIVSGYQEFEYARTALRYSVTDYLLKPVNAQELIKNLNAIKESIPPTHIEPQDATVARTLFSSLENYVLRHLSEQITLSSLCRHCGVSQTTANRVFRKFTDTSFLEYLTKKRINRACELLREDRGLMIKEIAALCGFCDPLYFSKVFKTYMGLTPSEYAANDDCKRVK